MKKISIVFYSSRAIDFKQDRLGYDTVIHPAGLDRDSLQK